MSEQAAHTDSPGPSRRLVRLEDFEPLVRARYPELAARLDAEVERQREALRQAILDWEPVPSPPPAPASREG